MKNFLTSVPNLLLTFTLCFALSSCSSTGVKMSESSPWETIQFEDQSNALDIDFIDNNHGFLVGSNRLIMESNDGCLLYTSPSPRDQRGSRMPSSA